MLRAKVLAWCREHDLFQEGGPVLAALSGGADSVAMLHLLLSLRGELGIVVRAAHYDHQLRGEASARDARFCQELCGTLGVELILGGGDVAAFARERELSLELAARKLRYEFLLAQDGLVATAHTANDDLETVLLNLTRGTALRGLCGIPPQRGRVVRPLLCLTRREIEGYLAENGLPHVEDESNAEGFCRRNRIRQTVIPALLAEDPVLLEGLPRTLVALREDESYLQAQADALLSAAKREGGFDVATLSAAARPLRIRALRRLLEDAGLRDGTEAHLLAAEALLHSGPSARIDLADGVVLRRVYGLVTTGLPREGPFAPFRLPLPGVAALHGKRVLICRGPLPYDPAGLDTGLCLKLSTPPLVRPRKTGDRIRLPGGSKAIKKWMIDEKVPAALRNAVPVLELEGRVAAVWGLGADPDFRPAPGEPCYQLTIEEVEDHDAPN